MKILSCFVPPTSGTASVAGFDVTQDSLEVRKRIGYLPENVPLYPDMRVTEYLRYRANLKGVPRRKVKERVEEVKVLTSLKDVETKMIGHLSKGYRQRVGLADAIVHEPDLVILDEPTIGLDPNQIRQVRDLIKDLGKKHTVLLSTHILPEVEMTCSRVLIINKGKILASDTPANLLSNASSLNQVKVVIRGPEQEMKKALESISDVREVRTTANGNLVEVLVFTPGNIDVREHIFRKVVDGKWTILELSQPRRTLEDVFVQLTQEDEEL